MCRGTLGVWGCECVCYGYLFGLFLLAPLLSQGCCRGVFGLGGVLWFCVVCVVGSGLSSFLRVEVVVFCGLFVLFLGASERSSCASPTERSEGGSCWWSSVVECLSGLVQAPRLVATPRLPADAARLTHVYNCLCCLSSYDL